jgi:Transposase DDE domain
MVLARSCGLTAVSYLLAQLLGRKPNTVRQQLREFCYEASDKRGQKRQQLEVEACFADLLGWILSWWQGQQLALALDATSLGARFVVLAISVVYRGCAIPVAWKVLRANRPHGWKGEWLGLLRGLRAALPRSLTVIVLADRGLYARWLYQQIMRLGWHPFLRVNAGGKFRPAGTRVFRSLASLAPRAGTRWSGEGSAFAKPEHRLECTLLACWEEGHQEAWLILTDLPPEAAQAGWYGLRAWIEQGFKITKRGGWQWQRTRMSNPKRAARLWLAVAVATLWLLSVGGAAEQAVPESTLLEVSGVLAEQQRQRRATRLRLVSIFRRGWVVILVALLHRARLPKGYFRPEPWPGAPSTPT